MTADNKASAPLDLEPAKAFAQRWSGVTPYASEVVRHIESLAAEVERLRATPVPGPIDRDGATRLICLMVDFLETDRAIGEPIPETSLGWLNAAKAWLATEVAKTGKEVK